MTRLNLLRSLRQRFFHENVIASANPDWNIQTVEDYSAKGEDINLIARSVDSLEPLTGEGDPNSVPNDDPALNVPGVTANNSRIYYQTDVNPPVQWFNPNPGANTGWVQL